MSGRSVALFAVVGISTLLYLGVPLGERRVYKPLIYGQEMAALKAIQSLNTAQVQYNSQFGRYARSLTELGPEALGFISADLATGEKQGYRFTLVPKPEGYSIQARPTVFGSTGSRTFYADQSLITRENYGPEPATAESREVGSAAAKSGRGAH